MKRFLLAAAVAGAFASGLAATPAQACEGKVDVACNETPCAPDYPCSINICVVWYSGRCLTN